jgi:hypothetical protein
MNKNQKIAVGCGAAGCLGLIVLALAAAAFFYWRSTQVPPVIARRSGIPTNSNSDQGSNSNANSDSSADGATATVSDDEKHRLFQAASMTQDPEVVQRVVKKLGLFKANGTPADDYPQFIRDHVSWGLSNANFINSINTPEKARAYVDAHLPE